MWTVLRKCPVKTLFDSIIVAPGSIIDQICISVKTITAATQ